MDPSCAALSHRQSSGHKRGLDGVASACTGNLLGMSIRGRGNPARPVQPCNRTRPSVPGTYSTSSVCWRSTGTSSEQDPAPGCASLQRTSATSSAQQGAGSRSDLVGRDDRQPPPSEPRLNSRATAEQYRVELRRIELSGGSPPQSRERGPWHLGNERERCPVRGQECDFH